MMPLTGKLYTSRRQAAQRLSESLAGYETHHPLILGIPRGGVVIADTIAQELNADLDIVLTGSGKAPIYRNDGEGTFTDVGAADPQGCPRVPGLRAFRH